MSHFVCVIGVSDGQIVMDVQDVDDPTPGTIYEQGRAVVGMTPEKAKQIGEALIKIANELEEDASCRR